MLQTLRIWKWTRRNGIGEWPWRKPWEVIEGWKFCYTRFGLQFLLERWRSFFYFHFYDRHTPKFKRELRRVYLGSRIRTLETLAKWAEEKADEANIS